MQSTMTDKPQKKRSVLVQISLLFFVTIVTAIVIAVVVIVNHESFSQLSAVSEKGTSVAENVAAVVENFGDDLFQSPDTPEYKDFRTLIKSICKDSDMEYITVAEYNLAEGKRKYYVCVAGDDEEDEEIQTILPFGYITTEDIVEQERLALSGQAVKDPYEIRNNIGHSYTWFAHVNNLENKNLLVLVEYSVSSYWEDLLSTALIITAAVVIFLLAVLIFQLIIIRRVVIKPLRTLSVQMSQFAHDHTYKDPGGQKLIGEMLTIHDSFVYMTQEIEAHIKNVERMTQERVQSQIEMDVAQKIQQGIVPSTFKRDGVFFEVSARSVSAREVGGDFFDCVVLNNEKVFLIEGDVSGKGVGAALFMSLLKTTIYNLVRNDSSPADILAETNAQICKSNPEGMFATVLIAMFDAKTGEVIMANGGHNAPLIAGLTVRELEVSPGVLIGLFDDAAFVNETFILNEGETFVIYTDGVSEAVNIKKEFLGKEKVMEDLAADLPTDSADEVVDCVMKIVRDFRGEADQFDDVTLLSLRRKKANQELKSKKINLALSHDSFAQIKDAVSFFVDNKQLMRKICMACEEYFVNVISYSQAEVCTFEIEKITHGIKIVFEDDGTAFDIVSAKPVEKDFEDLDTGGMGINLIKTFADDLSYKHIDGKNHVEILFHTDTNSK